MGKLSRKKLKREARERIALWNFPEEIVSEFEQNSIYCSERRFISVNRRKMIFPALTRLTKEEHGKVKAFENKHNALVYHAVKTNTKHGLLLTLLQISPHEFEWEEDKKELRKNKEQLCYTINMAFEEYSEFSWCSFDELGGGLLLRG